MAVSLRGHPPGAYLLVFTELLERFSYYGMRGLLILFMTREILEGGLAWPEKEAIAFYGLFTSLIWFAPLFGGWIADWRLGQRRSVLIGGVLMAAGHFALVGSTFAPSIFALVAGVPLEAVEQSGIGLGGFGLTASETQLLAATADPTSVMLAYHLVSALFLGGLGLIVLGNGLLKPNITVMLGEFYPREDPRRDVAYTLFYVGISLGAFLAALTAGTAGEVIGWRYGFGICGAVMAGGIVFYAVAGDRLLGEVGKAKPAGISSISDVEEAVGRPARVGLRADSGPSALAATLYIGFLSLFATLFWMGYEQAGGLLNLYIYERVDRSVLGLNIPATWLLSLPAVFCILTGVWVATMLNRVEERGIALDTPRRFALGLAIGSLAFALLGAGVLQATDAGVPLSVAWVFAFYLVLTIAELALSPAGFAMVTRVAPSRLSGRLMGLWLLSVALGSWLAGQIGAFATDKPIHQILFGLGAIFLSGGGILLLLRTRLLRLIEPRPQPTPAKVSEAPQ